MHNFVEFRKKELICEYQNFVFMCFTRNALHVLSDFIKKKRDNERKMHIYVLNKLL